MMNEIQEIRKC